MWNNTNAQIFADEDKSFRARTKAIHGVLPFARTRKEKGGKSQGGQENAGVFRRLEFLPRNVAEETGNIFKRRDQVLSNALMASFYHDHRGAILHATSHRYPPFLSFYFNPLLRPGATVVLPPALNTKREYRRNDRFRNLIKNSAFSSVHLTLCRFLCCSINLFFNSSLSFRFCLH